MGHPAEYFIKFSLAKSYGDDECDDSSYVAMNKTLFAFSLPLILENQYERILVGFNPPEGFRFYNKKHAATVEFMRDEKISTLWSPSHEDRRVLSELVDGNMLIKYALHILLMGGIPHDVVAAKLNSKYRLNPLITERMISTYAHYFWNVTNASHNEWAMMLESDQSESALIAALHCGEQQALYRAGFSPRLDGTRAMKEAYRQAYFRMEALRSSPDTKLTIDNYSRLTARLTNIHEILYSQGTGLQDQLRQFRQIMMTHKDPDVRAVDKIIDKLEGGSYSEDGDDMAPGEMQ